MNVTSSKGETEVKTPVPTILNSSDREAGMTAPVPAPRRTVRANARVHSNPHHDPKSARNAISLSPDVLSQLLTSMGPVFFREAVKVKLKL